MQRPKHIREEGSSSSDEEDDNIAVVGRTNNIDMGPSTAAAAAALQPSAHYGVTALPRPPPAPSESSISSARRPSELMGGGIVAPIMNQQVISYGGEQGIFVPLSAANTFAAAGDYLSLALANTLRQQLGSSATSSNSISANSGMYQQPQHPLFLGGGSLGPPQNRDETTAEDRAARFAPSSVRSAPSSAPMSSNMMQHLTSVGYDTGSSRTLAGAETATRSSNATAPASGAAEEALLQEAAAVPTAFASTQRERGPHEERAHPNPAFSSSSAASAFLFNDNNNSNGGGNSTGTSRGHSMMVGGMGDELLLSMLRGHVGGGSAAPSLVTSAWGVAMAGGPQLGGMAGSTNYYPPPFSNDGGHHQQDQHQHHGAAPTSAGPANSFLLARALLQEQLAATAHTSSNVTAGGAPSANNLPMPHGAFLSAGGSAGGTSGNMTLPSSTADLLHHDHHHRHHYQEIEQRRAVGMGRHDDESSLLLLSQSRRNPPPAPGPPLHQATGRKPKLMHTRSDDESLSPYQCLVRRQIEVFEASHADIHTTAQGRNRPIVLGQVGIRCIHCGHLPVEKRARGAVYFPSTLLSTYQTAQNMANTHLIKDCFEVPRAIREDLIRIRLRENSESKNTRKSAFGGGRGYWASGLQAHGVIETDDRRLRFEDGDF